ncbi:MAG: glycoside hydrolase [Spirochaetaceae bacterium]|nr:MAG: glycoside hydrolase [Spirochaetaceae bacterium]
MRTSSKRTRINLNGTWKAVLDPEDQGRDARWFLGTAGAEEHMVELPGAIQNQGIGEPPGPSTHWIGSEFGREYFEDPRYEPYRHAESYKYPYWLQPDRRYIGAVWYTREFTVPSELEGKELRLILERPHWETTVWVDGKCLGSDDSLSTPHCYELGSGFAAGSHVLAVRVDNSMIYEVGPNAHSVSDHTQGNWNGIIGDISIEAHDSVWIESINLASNLRNRSLLVRATIRNAGVSMVDAGVCVTSPAATRADAVASESPQPTVTSDTHALTIRPHASADVFHELVLDPECAYWDEFNPNTFEVSVSLSDISGGAAFADTCSLSTGLREISTEGRQLRVNGNRCFLRGTLECCVFPLTGYPPTDLAHWMKVMGRVQEFGLNHVRFHSWCPPEAAFAAADSLGVYLQVEAPVWANQGASVGHDDRFSDWHFRESERIISEFGHHPSFVMMTAGNEPSGRIDEYLALWVSYWKERDGGRLFSSGAGWPAIPENDYHNVPEPRVQAWGQGLSSRINGSPPETVSDYDAYVAAQDRVVVSHEIGQWCVFPDFHEMAKYTGPLKPRNFEIFRELLESNGLGEDADRFHYASGKLQVLCYKEEIESALRTHNFGGFQLLGLNDFPGQGTALVGVLDPFWDPKTYVSAEMFRSFCGPTVPLLRLSRRYYRSSDVLSGTVEVSHFGGYRPVVREIHWSVLDDTGTPVRSGTLQLQRRLERGLDRVGALNVPLAGLAAPARYEVEVSVPEHESRNTWDVWVYPEPEPASDDPDGTDGPLVVTVLDQDVLEKLAQGASILYVPTRDQMRSDIAVGFSTVFWNTAWTGGQAPHTLGIVCDPEHAALAEFPTEWHSNWQWWELMQNAGAFVLDGFTTELKPIVSAVDTWFRSHRLCLLFEARVGRGRLIASSMDIVTDLDNRIVARQLRTSVDRYMAGPAFDPTVTLEASAVPRLLD